MSWQVLLFIQISIGALIGGVTNELAIRMLFRPYKPVFIGKWRVPFTPGLIPKRHAELAHQMGKLVENFLITPEGVRRMLRKNEFEQQMKEWLIHKLEELGASEDTVEAFLQRCGVSFNEDWADAAKRQLELYLMKKVTQTSYSTLEEVLPLELRTVLESKVEDAAPFLLDKMGEYLASQEGSDMVKQMLSQLTGGLGMLGGLATMLLSDEKVIQKVSSSLESALRNEELKGKLGAVLVKELRGLYKKQMGELIHWVGEDQVEKVIHYLVSRLVDFDSLRSKKLSSLLAPILPQFREQLPGLVSRLFDWVETHLETGLKKINLTHIAASEVEAFPVAKLEEMIIHITGKELKMITVFGAVLGGLIGLVQGLLVLFA